MSCVTYPRIIATYRGSALCGGKKWHFCGQGGGFSQVLSVLANSQKGARMHFCCMSGKTLQIKELEQLKNAAKLACFADFAAYSACSVYKACVSETATTDKTVEKAGLVRRIRSFSVRKQSAYSITASGKVMSNGSTFTTAIGLHWLMSGNRALLIFTLFRRARQPRPFPKKLV